MEYPENLKYTKDHEWIRVEGGDAIVGITAFAQSQLGDVVFVELPKVGKTVKQHDQFCVVESTKAASDVFAPVGGNVKETNSALSGSPDLLNQSPYTDGWIAKLSGVSASEVAGLMSASEYRKLVGE